MHVYVYNYRFNQPHLMDVMMVRMILTTLNVYN